MPRCREAAISGAAKLISFMPDPSSSARLPCRAGRYDTGQLRNPPLRQRRWRRERGSNRRSLRERVGPLRPKGNAVVAKRGSLVSTVSEAGDRGFKSFSRYPIGPLETPYFTPFLKSGETSLVTGFRNKKSP